MAQLWSDYFIKFNENDIPSIEELQRSAGGRLNIYRHGPAKWQFVILGGTTTLEVARVLFVIPICYFTWCVLEAAYGPTLQAQRPRLYMLAQAFILLLPPLLSMTTEYFILVYQAIMILFALGCIIRRGRNVLSSHAVELRKTEGAYQPHITAGRAFNMMMTVMAIVAVDFPEAFPLRFAKCDHYGYSVMDIGVGLVVLFGSLTARRTREAAVALPTVKTVYLTFDERVWRWARDVFSAPLILVLLGIWRNAGMLVWGEPNVKEYGVYWNFWFTLAVTTLIFNLVSIPVNYGAFFGAGVMIVYQYALSLGLKEHVINKYHPRQIQSWRDIVYQNKEGMCSAIGYTALGFFSAHIGSWLLRRRTVSETYKMIAQLLLLVVVLWTAQLWVDKNIDMVSRQQANLAYILWVLAMFCSLVIPMILVDLFVKTMGREPPVLLAISRNPLVYFLVGNLSDGVVTFFLGKETPQLVSILGLYLDTLALAGLVYYMYAKNITIKLLR